MMTSTINQTKAFCTIISKNYLAYARTLCQSLKLHHPDIPCFVLIVDHIENKFEPSQENFVTIDLESLDIPNFYDFSFKYTLVELSTAVKPYFLEYLIEHYKLEKLIYLDPDIYVYQSLNTLFSLLDIHSVILTPHITQSYPEDNKIMRDKHILLSGLYNLGFIAIANNVNGMSLIKWWQQKLYDQCIVDFQNGFFVDQKWMDFAPIMFDEIYILKKSGYNIGYWNLHENKIGFKENSWYCNDEPLYFYHFSGIFLNKIEIISKYQTRYTLLNKPELRALFENYRQCLIQNKYNECINWSYTYDFYKNGRKISPEAKKSYYKLGKLRNKIFTEPFELNILQIFGLKLLIKILDFCRNFVSKNLNLESQDKIKLLFKKIS